MINKIGKSEKRFTKRKYLSLLLVLSLIISLTLVSLPNLTYSQATKMEFTNLDAEVDLKTAELTMFKWGEEAWLKYGSPLATFKESDKTTLENRAEFKADGFEINIYGIDIGEGGIEYEFVLYQNPYTNTFTIPIESQNLDFYYQPALTEEEIANGAFRPEKKPERKPRAKKHEKINQGWEAMNRLKLIKAWESFDGTWTEFKNEIERGNIV